MAEPSNNQEQIVFLTESKDSILLSQLSECGVINASLAHGLDVSPPQSPTIEDHTQVLTSHMSRNSRVEADNACINRSQTTGVINLHNAVCVNNIDAVEEWLVNNGSTDHDGVNQTDKYGFTPLHYAAKFNRVHIFEILLQKGRADPTIQTTKERFTALHLAARCKSDLYEGDDVPDTPPSGNIVHSLVAQPKIKVNDGDSYGVSPLHMACQCGNLEAVKNLLSHINIMVNVKDKNGDTPLHEACLRGETDIVSELLKKMKAIGIVKIDMSNESGLTPLHLACREGYVKIVELLLKHCKDFTDVIKAKDVEGATSLHLACLKSNAKVVKVLLKYREADILVITGNKDGLTPIHIAAQYGHCSAMEVLLEAKHYAVDVRDTFSQTPMHFAAEYGQTEMLQLLHKKYGASLEVVDAHCYTPLLTAVENGQTEAFQMLLKFCRPNMLDIVNKDGKSALFLAAESNYLKIIGIILDHPLARKLCLTADSNHNTPLHIAAANGHLDVVKRLAKHRIVKLYAKNCLNKTAMHLAAENGHTNVVKELLDDCNIKYGDQDGNTPLHLACTYGFEDIVQLLVDNGADVESRNTILWTPLGCAASSGHDRIVQQLICAKAKINPKDKSKKTPLHLASREGHLATVDILVQNHADVSCRDDNGFNALDWAIENGHKDVVKLFILSSRWKDALDNITSTRSGRMTTPFRKLIIKMPDVAELALNKCTEPDWSSEGNTRVQPYLNEYTVTFNFELLEDLQRFKENYETDQRYKHERKKTVLQHQSIENPTEKVSSLLGLKKLKHPLTVMVESKQTELLKHPLVNSLLDYKWNKFGRYLFSGMLIFHITFVVLLTSFYLMLLSPVSNTCRASSCNSTDVAANSTNDSDHLINSTIEKAATFVKSFQCGQSNDLVTFLKTSAMLIIVISVLRLALECYQIIQLLQDYFSDISNWIEVPLFVFSITSVLVLQYECLCPRGWQWQIGIIALFLAWVDLILFMRQVRLMDTGIYVLMFESIFKTFLKMIILTILLAVTFALAFYMAFHQFDPLYLQSPFANPFRALIKTMTMTTGEFDYENIFHYSSGGIRPDEFVLEVPFPVVSVILWVMFLILMPILLANMLVGLAVDDIKGIQDAATLTRLALRVKLVLSLEAKFLILPCLHRRNIPLELKVKIGRQQKWHSWFKQLLKGEDFSSVEHISSTLNPSKTPLEEQTVTLTREMQKMQETLHMLTMSIQELKSQLN